MVQPLQPRCFDYQALDNNYKIKISNRFEAVLQCDEERTPDELWKEGQDIMLSVAEETVCKKKKKINRWMSDETLKEVEKRRYIKAKGIRDTVEEAAYKWQNSKIQQMMRKNKETFIQEQCQQIEGSAIINSIKDLHQGIKNLTKKFHPTIDTIKNEDGIIICNRHQGIALISIKIIKILFQ